MAEFRLCVLHRTRALCTVVVACALLAPMQSRAQTGQVIVMSCTSDRFPGGEPINYTLDLALKTVTIKSITPNPGGSPDPLVSVANATITQISDQEIAWLSVQSDPSLNTTSVLNRYTGKLISTAANGSGNEYSCQRQQKQF